MLVSLKPCGRGIVMEVLRYAEEVNRAANYFRDIADAKPDAELLDLATSLIARKTGDFDASAWHNHYIDALHRLIDKKAKAKGKRVLEEVDEPVAAGKSNVIDLMAALKASIGGKASAEPAAAKPAAKRAARPRAAAKKRA